MHMWAQCARIWFWQRSAASILGDVVSYACSFCKFWLKRRLRLHQLPRWQRFVLYFAMPTYVVEWTYECKGCDLLKTVEKESLYKKDVIGFKEPPRPKCYNCAQHSGVQEKRKNWRSWHVLIRCSLSAGLKQEFKSQSMSMKSVSRQKSLAWMPLRKNDGQRNLNLRAKTSAVLSHLSEQLCCSIRWVRARKQNNNILLTSFCVKNKCMLHALPYTLYHSLYDQRFIALGAATPSLTTSGSSLWGHPFPHLLPAACRFGGSHSPMHY